MSANLFERMAGLGPQDVPDERAAKSIAALRERFETMTAMLSAKRFARPDGTSRSVHELPWYVVIGAPGTGNSSVLGNSGLRFPLQDKDEPAQLTGVGGTRYCEWWFADEAVFLDTAGRYVAHETKNLKDALAGSAAWHAFLGLLKQHRPRQPINGAIVTVSVTDLLLWAKPERQQFAAHVRMRLSELYAGLGTRFPVYLLVTKMDLLAGFIEFFGALDDEKRAQVWGTTFSAGADPVDIARDYAADFASLQNRLHAEMLGRLDEEPDLVRRASIYRFPSSSMPSARWCRKSSAWLSRCTSITARSCCAARISPARRRPASRSIASCARSSAHSRSSTARSQRKGRARASS